MQLLEPVHQQILNMRSRLVLAFLVILNSKFCDAQQNNYKVYPNTSSPDFESIPPASSFAVATFSDCVIQSLANQVANNGAMYNSATSTCVLFTALNNEVVVRLHTNASWTSLVKDFSNVYMLVLKIQGGQSTSGGGILSGGGQYSFFNYMSGTNGMVYSTSWNSATQSFNKNNSCNCTYRNAYLDYWNSSNSAVKTSMVRVRFWLSGLKVVEMTFNSSVVDRVTWFTLANLMSIAPYSKQLVLTSSYCGNAGIDIGTLNGQIGLQAITYCSTCTTDAGFFGIWATSSMCSYVYGPLPFLYYSMTNSYSPFSALANNGAADFLSVEVKSSSRAVFITP